MNDGGGWSGEKRMMIVLQTNMRASRMIGMFNVQQLVVKLLIIELIGFSIISTFLFVSGNANVLMKCKLISEASI